LFMALASAPLAAVKKVGCVIEQEE
jgi:hypothetical protein